MGAIFKKELKTIFFSPVGYVVIAIFLIIFSGMFYVFSVSNRSIDLGTIYFAIALYGLPIITTVLTMKSFAGERSKDTEQLLYSSPKSTISIVMGKFLPLVTVIGITLILSSIYYFILKMFGNPSGLELLVTWLGFLLLSMAYISFGVLVSSITGNQIITALITLVFLMSPVFVSFSSADGVFSYLTLIDFYQKFASGVIALREVVCLASFTIMCILITTIVINNRRY